MFARTSVVFFILQVRLLKQQCNLAVAGRQSILQFVCSVGKILNKRAIRRENRSHREEVLLMALCYKDGR